MSFNKFQRRHSLKTRVTAFTLVIFLVSIWSLAFFARQTLRDNVQTVLGEQQYSTATLVAGQIHHDLTDRLHALARVASGIRPETLENPALLQAHLQGLPIFLDLFNGGVFITGMDGMAIASVPLAAERQGVNYLDRDYIVAALREAKATVGRPISGKKLAAPIVAMAAPIRDAQGKVIGAVAGVTNLGERNFLDDLMENRYGQTGGYLLIAPQYRLVVTATDKARIMQPLPATGSNAMVDDHIQDRTDRKTVIGVGPQGLETLTSMVPVPAADWRLLVSLPTDEAFAPIHAIQLRLALATILLTVLAGGLSWWMLRRELEPMLAASRRLSDLSGTDLPWQPLPIARADEVGRLIDSFNRLLGELGQRETLLRQILNTSSVAIFLVDLQGRITRANQRMADMFGYPQEALPGLEYVELVNPAERELARQKMLALLASSIPAVDSDRRYWRADGTEFWGHLSGARFIDAEGRQQGLIGVIADITERKRAEEKLVLHDNMMTAIIENIPCGISMIDSNLHLIAFNTEFKQLLDLPDSVFQKPDLKLEDLFRFNAQRGEYGPGDIDRQVAERVERARNFEPHRFERSRPNGQVLEIHGEPVPGGGFVTIYLDITERKQMEQQVRELAFYDPLTHLPNRRLFNDRLGLAIAAGKRSGCYGALLFLDLDNFKALNDTHGHGAGDLLLIEAAIRLRKCVRETDTVARLGGDEFVVVVGDLNVDKAESTAQARIVAQKVSAALAEPYHLVLKQGAEASAQIEHQCTASVGVAVFLHSEGSEEDFVKWADAAMYQAKEAGSGLTRFWEFGT